MPTPLPKAFWPLTIGASNNKIDVRRSSDNADFVATIASATYYSADALAHAVQTALCNCGWNNHWGCEVGGQNMCFNPSVEYDGVGTVGGWGQYNNSAALEPFTYWGLITKMGAWDTAPFPNGLFAIGMSWVVNNTTTKGAYTNMNTGGAILGWRRGQTCVVSFWALAGGTNVGQTMHLAFNGGPASLQEISNPPLSGVWQKYEFRLWWNTQIPGPGMSGVVGELYLTIGGTGTNGSLYLDDVRVTSVDTGIPTKRGHILIPGQDDFMLRWGSGPNSANSARNVLGFDGADQYSTWYGAQYVLSPYQHQNGWYGDLPVRFDSKPRYDRVVSSEVSHAGRMKSVVLGSPREMRSIELGSLPAWKTKLEREVVGARVNESIERLWRDGYARFRWWSDAADESCGRDYRLDGDALTAFNPAREHNTPEKYSLAMNLRRYVA